MTDVILKCAGRPLKDPFHSWTSRKLRLECACIDVLGTDTLQMPCQQVGPHEQHFKSPHIVC